MAILGATISPYLFLWQSSQEVEDEIAMGHKQLWLTKGVRIANCGMPPWDVTIEMYFIILATAATLHQAGKTHIQTAADAAIALVLTWDQS